MAKSIYVAQTTQGGDTGVDAANAHSMVWLNTAGNWGAGGSQVNPGDTVRLLGTLTSVLTIQAAGSSGNITTIYFEPNAKFSAATWTAGTHVISATSKSYITIDGGLNGMMEATNNGQFLSFQNDWRACYFTSCDHITVKNINFKNMYVRTSGDTNVNCDGVNFDNLGSNCLVDNCMFSYAFSAVYAVFQGTGNSTFTFSNNTVLFCAAALEFGDGNAGSTFSGVNYINNYYDNSSVWFDVADAVHAEGLHFYAVNGGGSAISNVVITNSFFGPDTSGSHTTAHVYLEGGISGSPLIANNVFKQQSPYISNGAIYNKSSATANIMNNTFISDGAGLCAELTSAGNILKNNICFDHNDWTMGSAGTCDYNIIYSTPSSSSTEGAHSLTSNPLIDSLGILQPGSPAINAGLDEAVLFTTDKNGLIRPQGPSWCIGAYEFFTRNYAKPKLVSSQAASFRRRTILTR